VKASLLVSVLAGTVLGLACGGSPMSPSTTESGGSISTGPLVLKASPIATSGIEFIAALGNLNPPGHTLPTSHIYFYHRLFNRSAAPLPIVSPGDGRVQWILSADGEAKIGIRQGVYTFFLGHIVLDPGIIAGMAVTAGQRLGMTGNAALGIDLGVINEGLDVFFVNPARYPDETRHGDAPLKYFEEPLRSDLYARVNRLGPDKDGKFDYDVPGTLSGNWFHEGLAPGVSANPEAWSRHLAFARDNYDPSAARISMGGALGPIGAFGIVGPAPDFAAVTVSSGMVVYNVGRAGAPGEATTQSTGRVLVQMLDAQRIRVEYTAMTSGAVDFTASARIYTR
jgi:hypothetical protein